MMSSSPSSFPMPYQTMAVFGLARAGLAAVQFLRRHDVKVLAWDDEAEPRARAAALGAQTQDFVSTWADEIECLVLAPGVPYAHNPHAVVQAATAAGAPIVGDMDLFQWARAPHAAPVIAISGTNGKSTASALLAHCLGELGYDAQLGGNIGVSVLALQPPSAHGVYVLELSSYQLELARAFAPDAGALLNITPDHLARHGSLESYVAAKERLTQLVAPDGLLVLGVDDKPMRALAERTDARAQHAALCRISAYGQQADIMFDGQALRDPKGRALLEMGQANLRGAHNAQNAAAVYALLQFVLRRLPPPQPADATSLAAAFASFPGLAHRLQEVARVGGVRCINDSKATNGEAAAVALAAMAGTALYWLAGGEAKAESLDALEDLRAVRRAYVFGEAASLLGARARAAGVACEEFATLDDAFAAAWAEAKKNVKNADKETVILLSPACASFDQYQDFEARGRAFQNLVRARQHEAQNKKGHT